MTTTMKLVDRGQPRHLTGQEIQELTERRVAVRTAWKEQERQRRAEERAVWRRSGARRRRFWTAVVAVFGVVTLVGLVYLARTETQAALFLVAALALVAVSIRYAR